MAPSTNNQNASTAGCGRGEALNTVSCHPLHAESRQRENAAPASPSWHVLWTHSNCERAVHDTLHAKGYELLFARMEQWIADKKGKHLAHVPMFRSYLFLRHAVGKHDYIDICNTKGLVRILGERWDRLAVIPDREIHNIRSVCSGDLPVSNHPFLAAGDRVRMTRGSLKNTEGILVKNNPHSGLLVVSVSLLNRSVAVEVNCTDVEPL